MGNRIQQLRKAKNLTQEQLGEILCLQKSAVAKYERGAVENIKIENLKKMADFFDCSIDFLLGIENSDALSKTEMELVEKYRNLPNSAQSQLLSIVSELSHLYPNDNDNILNEATPIAAHGNNESLENIEKDIQKALEFIRFTRG